MKMIDKIIADIPKLDIEKEDSKYKNERNKIYNHSIVYRYGRSLL